MVNNNLAAKVNNIDTSRIVLKTKDYTDKSDLDKKIPDISRIVKKKTDYNAKIIEIECEIPSISGLAANTSLTTVENKAPNISNLVKKQIIMQKYQVLNLYILLLVIIINLLKILLLN